MNGEVITVPYSFISHDGKTRIRAKLWTTDYWGSKEGEETQRPQAIIQIVHGMAEHIDRYDHFARYLVSQGFAVCAEDHIGHGRSVETTEDLGHMPIQDGKSILVGDVHTLYCMTHSAFPNVPYLLYGHSMGSLIARVYIATYGEELTACVLAGTAHGPKLASRVGESLAHLIASIKGEHFRSKFLDKLGVGSYGKKIPNARTSLDWLSTVDSVVDEYMADELSGQMFTVGGYATLLSLVNEVTTSQWAQAVPKNLPILFIAGDQDPVGNMGKGVHEAAELLRSAGVVQVSEKIYPGLRHELHNESQRDQVYAYITHWLDGVLNHTS